MNTVIDISARHGCAPAALAKDESPTAAQKQSGTALGRGIPQAHDAETAQGNPGEDLSAALTRLSDYVQSIQRTLEFSVDEDTGRTVVKVIDGESKEVIRQIPSEEVLHIAKQLAANANDGSQDPRGFFLQVSV